MTSDVKKDYGSNCFRPYFGRIEDTQKTFRYQLAFS
jgi:hypothetical protein